VTGLSTWSTSDSSIATADSVGFVTVHRDGTVAIRVSYHGLEGFATVQLVVGGLRRDYRTVSGFITDAADGTKHQSWLRDAAGPLHIDRRQVQ